MSRTLNRAERRVRKHKFFGDINDPIKNIVAQPTSTLKEALHIDGLTSMHKLYMSQYPILNRGVLNGWLTPEEYQQYDYESYNGIYVFRKIRYTFRCNELPGSSLVVLEDDSDRQLALMQASGTKDKNRRFVDIEPLIKTRGELAITRAILFYLGDFTKKKDF